MLDCSYGLIAQLGERSVRIRKVEGSTPLRVHKTPYRVKRYGVSFCRSLQNRASFVLTTQSDVCRTFRHNVHSFTRSFVKNDDSPIRSTQPPNGCLFKVRFPPTRSTHRERMTLKFFKGSCGFFNVLLQLVFKKIDRLSFENKKRTLFLLKSGALCNIMAV